MGEGPTISNFKGKYEFLSNFYTGPGSDVTINGIHYATTEHAFQAGKFVKRSLRRQVADCATPGDSKRFARALARKVGNRSGWKEADISIYWMLKCIRLKFTHPVLARKLVSTHPLNLIEGNTWGDAFWGMVRDKDGRWRGDNWLGKILTHVRAELIAGEQIPFSPKYQRERDARLNALFN